MTEVDHLKIKKTIITRLTVRMADNRSVVSLVPRRLVTGEKSAWYPLFAHARLPMQVFVGNLETTVILVHVARPYIY